MNANVGHKLLLHLVASKEAVFIKAAIGKLDLNLRPFFALLILFMGARENHI